MAMMAQFIDRKMSSVLHLRSVISNRWVQFGKEREN